MLFYELKHFNEGHMSGHDPHCKDRRTRRICSRGVRASLLVAGCHVLQTCVQWSAVRTGLGAGTRQGMPLEEHSLRQAIIRGRCYCWFINQSPHGRQQKTRLLSRCAHSSSRLPPWGTLGNPTLRDSNPPHPSAFAPFTQACLSG